MRQSWGEVAALKWLSTSTVEAHGAALAEPAEARAVAENEGLKAIPRGSISKRTEHERRDGDSRRSHHGDFRRRPEHRSRRLAHGTKRTRPPAGCGEVDHHGGGSDVLRSAAEPAGPPGGEAGPRCRAGGASPPPATACSA